MAFDVYLKEKAFSKINSHFQENASSGLEALGFLVGSVFSNEGRKFVVVEDYLTAENEATSVTVRFSREAFKTLSEKLSENGEIIVGWCHSHPGYGCFLSSTDVRTQKVFFPEEFHVAMVCDPLRKECKIFRVSGEEEMEVSFAVVRKKNGS
ncbi:MAG: Mov34/MPN/PAD-1 family protein [Candidatus Micrarchaeota archaeon]